MSTTCRLLVTRQHERVMTVSSEAWRLGAPHMNLPPQLDCALWKQCHQRQQQQSQQSSGGIQLTLHCCVAVAGCHSRVTDGAVPSRPLHRHPARVGGTLCPPHRGGVGGTGCPSAQGLAASAAAGGLPSQQSLPGRQPTPRTVCMLVGAAGLAVSSCPPATDCSPEHVGVWGMSCRCARMTCGTG
jgi:hypothetical protein